MGGSSESWVQLPVQVVGDPAVLFPFHQEANPFVLVFGSRVLFQLAVGFSVRHQSTHLSSVVLGIHKDSGPALVSRQHGDCVILLKLMERCSLLPGDIRLREFGPFDGPNNFAAKLISFTVGQLFGYGLRARDYVGDGQGCRCYGEVEAFAENQPLVITEMS